MMRTKINGKYVADAPKDLTRGPTPNAKQLLLQRNAMAEALKSISQCKSITEVRKCLVHAREVYPI